MKKRYLRSIYVLLLVLMLATSFALPPMAGAQGIPADAYVQGEIVVLTQPGVSNQAASAVLSRYGATIAQTVSADLGIYVVKLPAGYSVDQAISSFSANSTVAMVGRNWVYKVSDDVPEFTKQELPKPDFKPASDGLPEEVKSASGTMDSVQLVPNDPYVPYQWGLNKINAFNGWDAYRFGSTSQIIAITDSGVDYNHPDFRDWGGAYRFAWPAVDLIDASQYGWDYHGHGTHVTGIAAATAYNGTGVAGVNWQTKILNVRVLNAAGSGTTASVYGGLLMAAGRGAKVINASWGRNVAYPGDPIEQYIVDYVYRAGSLLVAAAGNDNTEAGYPARYNHVMAVSATGASDEKASYSNWSSSGKISVAAPGGNGTGNNWYTNIGSTMPRYAVTMNSGGVPAWYGAIKGTSMASPFVAGAAAIIAAANPSWTSDQIRSRLQSTADDLGTAGYDGYFGYGRINLGAALGVGPTRFTGRVTSTSNGAGIAGVVVYLYPTYNYAYTDANGYYTINNVVVPGTAASTNYYVIAQKAGYNTPYVYTSISRSTTKTVNLSMTPLGAATATGVISNATNNAAISGATVAVYRTTGALVGSTTTNASGVYSIGGLPTSGVQYYIVASKTGFSTNYAGPITYPGSGTYTTNISLSPTLTASQFRVVLTWGATPSDLDSHTWLPVPPSPAQYHVKWTTKGNPSAFPFTKLDVDDTSSYGPETTTVYTGYNGYYFYSVYNWSGTPAIAGSGAKVTVYRAGSALPAKVYTVPASGSGRWWSVLFFNPVTGSIVDVNQIRTTPGSGTWTPYNPTPSDEGEDQAMKIKLAASE